MTRNKKPVLCLQGKIQNAFLKEQYSPFWEMKRKFMHKLFYQRARNDLAVNEQNPLAKGFYQHMGFEVYKRTKCDEQGNPYPLLYMKLD